MSPLYPVYDPTTPPPSLTDLGDLMEAQWLLVEVGQLHAGLAARHGRALPTLPGPAGVASGSRGVPVLLENKEPAGIPGRLALAA